MMKTNSLLIAGMAAVTALGAASVALAQAKPPAKPAAAAPAPARPAAAPAAAPPAQPITVNVPGVCALSQEGVVAQSKVGKYVQTRLQQLNAQVTAELNAERTSLDTDVKSYSAKKATLAAAQQQQQEQALEQRAQAFDQKLQLRQSELQATQQKAIQRIMAEASPLVGPAIQAKSCGIVLDGNVVIAANGNMDLTPGIVTALDAKITQFDFDREHLDQQAPAAAK